MMKKEVRAVVHREREGERKERCLSLHKEALCLSSTKLCVENITTMRVLCTDKTLVYKLHLILITARFLDQDLNSM